MHIDEGGSGHPGLTEGMYLARIEDGFSPRLIGRHIDDGFTLDIDPSGIHTAFALIQSNVDDPESGHLVAFRSVDGGVTWGAGQRVVDGQAVNPVLIQARNGSMLGGKSLEFIYTPTLLPPFDSVLSSSIDLGVTDTDDRYDYHHAGSDGVMDYVRHYRDVRGDRAYTYTIDNAADGSHRLTYSYTSGDYTQTYTASSDGNFRYENSDGYQYDNVPTKLVQYWYDDVEDGARNYIYIFRDPAEEILWWAIYDFNTAGSYDFTYVYYRGAYYYVEFRYADGRSLRYDSTGFYEAQ
jgi:hypothetical protein